MKNSAMLSQYNSEWLQYLNAIRTYSQTIVPTLKKNSLSPIKNYGQRTYARKKQFFQCLESPCVSEFSNLESLTMRWGWLEDIIHSVCLKHQHRVGRRVQSVYYVKSLEFQTERLARCEWSSDAILLYVVFVLFVLFAMGDHKSYVHAYVYISMPIDINARSVNEKETSARN